MEEEKEIKHRSIRFTSDEIDRRFQRAIEESVEFYADYPEHIDRRLEQLDKEWNLDRWLQANAAALGLVGVGLSAVAGRKWLLLPTVVMGFLLQHSLQGWCPPVHLFRRMGVRTKEETLREYYQLRALQGYFDTLADSEQEEKSNS